MITQGAPPQNPFPGLRPFRADEERFFFGRESQVDTMVNTLAATRFLAVMGTSGSGKSSLVNCGLRPALHRGLMASAGPTWRIAQFRPGSDPIDNLAEALAAEGVLFSGHNEDVPIAEIVKTYLHASTKGLVETFRKARLPEGTNLLVVADQFEELFRYRKLQTGDSKDQYTTPEDAIAFVNLLLEPRAQPECPIYVVITMRSDFLGDCSQFYALPEAINRGPYLIPRMTRDERRASIAGPVSVGGAEISSVLLTRLVNDVGDNPDQLSILQHALNRTWACWQDHGAKGALQLEHYEEIGTMGEALNRHADEAFNQLKTPEKQKLCEKIFKALTDLGTDPRGVRRPLKLATLNEIVGTNSGEEVKDVIEVFREPTRSFLMPPKPEPLVPAKVIDISHESLMRVWERLRRWAEDEATSARRFRRLAETATLEKTGNARLWRDPDLQVALDWQEEQSPTPVWANLYGGDFESAISFLQRSQSDRDHELAEVIFARRWKYIKRGIFIAIAGVFLWRFLAGDFESWSETFGYKLRNAPAPPTEGLQQTVRGITKELHSITVWKVLQLLLTLTCFLGPYFLGYFVLGFGGKWVFRRLTFARTLRQVALASKKAVREQKLNAEAARDAAAIRLQTTYASFWRRLGAHVLDLGVFLLGNAVVSASLLGILSLLNELPSWAALVPTGGLLITLILDWLYEVMMLRSRRQATLGMLALGIFATDLKGGRLSFGRATARHFARFLSNLTLGIGFLVQPFTRRRQALHDLIPGSVVLVKSKRVKWWVVVLCVVLGLVEVMPYAGLIAGLLMAASFSHR